MRLATVEQSREIDRLAQERYALPGDVLMEAAGTAAAREIEQAFLPELLKGATVIVCGPGNNGGDGLVVARHLHASGYKGVRVCSVAPGKGRSELFGVQLERCLKLGLAHVDLVEEPSRAAELKGAGLLVDAIFGIGGRAGKRAGAEALFSLVIETMNAAEAPVVSLDAPSGLDCDRGTVHGSGDDSGGGTGVSIAPARAAVRASMTCTFGRAKPGFFVNEGPKHVGRLRVLPIGFPRDLVRSIATTRYAFSEALARKSLPKRKNSSNKSDHGRLMVFAGRPGMWGAGLLAAGAAYRTGAGYVTLAGREEPAQVLTSAPEIMTAKIDAPGFWDPEKWDAVVIGPGFGAGRGTADLIERLRSAGVPSVVVDADALTACADFGLFPLPPSWILTPHAGELARVLKVGAKTIESDRFEHAALAARKTGCHVLLKGFRTVLASGDDRCLVIPSGNAALAKAGTGDVLAGMIGALLAQGLEPAKAAATAAYIHGRMADEWVRAGLDKRSLTASDLREHLPRVMAGLTT